MAKLNVIIHQPIRLRIMAALVTLKLDEEVDFTYLRNLLEVTDGNLGSHLRKLEDAGFIQQNKLFVDRKPRTYISITTRGREAFDEHVSALQEILQG